MMFQKKIDRAMNWLKEKNKKSDFDESINGLSEENQNYKFDKTDILAAIISALLVFGPIFIVLGFIVYIVL